MDEYYKITRNDISYEQTRDSQLEMIFGSDYKFITKLEEQQLYSITVYHKI